jgi:predicted RNase H-like HicB family nuclease
MTRNFTASVWKEGNWFVAQCLDVDVASQGETQDQALSNLRDALELYFEPPQPHTLPQLRTLTVDVNEAVAIP